MHTENHNLINERGNQKAVTGASTFSLSEYDWILQDLLKTLVSSRHSSQNQFGLCSLLIFDQGARDQKRKKEREEEENKERGRKGKKRC